MKENLWKMEWKTNQKRKRTIVIGCSFDLCSFYRLQDIMGWHTVRIFHTLVIICPQAPQITSKNTNIMWITFILKHTILITIKSMSINRTGKRNIKCTIKNTTIMWVAFSQTNIFTRPFLNRDEFLFWFFCWGYNIIPYTYNWDRFHCKLLFCLIAIKFFITMEKLKFRFVF